MGRERDNQGYVIKLPLRVPSSPGHMSRTLSSRQRDGRRRHRMLGADKWYHPCWESFFLFLEPSSRVYTAISHCRKKLLNKTWKSLKIKSARHSSSLPMLSIRRGLRSSLVNLNTSTWFAQAAVSLILSTFPLVTLLKSGHNKRNDHTWL